MNIYIYQKHKKTITLELQIPLLLNEILKLNQTFIMGTCRIFFKSKNISLLPSRYTCPHLLVVVKPNDQFQIKIYSDVVSILIYTNINNRWWLQDTQFLRGSSKYVFRYIPRGRMKCWIKLFIIYMKKLLLLWSVKRSAII